jgi:transcriptional regulator with XRE-family HTH domain
VVHLQKGGPVQGTELKAIRKKLGMTQTQFAQEIGMTQTYLSLMENGASTIERRTELAALYLELRVQTAKP